LHRIANNAFVVPPGAVLIGKDGPYVYTVNDEKKATPINVTVLTRTDEYIAIDSKELKKGQTVITDGQVNVAPGIVVNPTTK
jgi:multidrug efflux pump subunit AcrA (membrane-fusion protein)